MRLTHARAWLVLLALGCDTGPAPAAAPVSAPDQPALVAEALRWLDQWSAAQAPAARVRVSLGQVRTWLDGSGALAPPRCEITFMQALARGEHKEHGQKRLLVRREGLGDFRIIEEELLERTEAPAFSAMPDEPFAVTSPAPATALELHVSDMRESDDGARTSRTLLTVRSAGAAVSLHLDSDLALGEPTLEQDASIVVSSSFHAGRLVMFRLQREGSALTVAKRHRDEAGEAEPWKPYARVALGHAAPLPLRCAEAGQALKPCIVEHPSL